mgnify:FL=1
MKIAFQGELGSNSHTAVLQFYGDTPVETVPCRTFEEAFSAIPNGLADAAVIPIDNSSNGRVADVHHLLPNSGLHIVGEHFLPIEFQLMGLKGSRAEDARQVLSHIHAHGQCRGVIRKYGYESVTVHDTAGAAKIISERGDPSQVALAPELAAELYGLDIYEAGVSDNDDNTTRFVVLAPNPYEVTGEEAQVVTSLVFKTRSVPAALYKALTGFATNGVNITKLESYIADASFAVAQFYADIDGAASDPAVALALQDLAYFSDHVLILGSYPASSFRRGG